MLIPSKFSGYSFDGSRRCFGGGGGGGGAGGDGGTGDAASATGEGAVGPGASGTGNGTGDGGGSGPGPGGDAGGGNTVYTPPGNVVNTGVNTNRGTVTGGNTAGTSTIPSNNLNLRNMYGVPYNQSGQQYNALLQQGFTGNDIRNALTTNGKPVSDSDYGFLVQDAGMKSPTGRPMAGSDQFFQPVYNSSYQNYARPSTQFDVSTYGTQPTNSPAFNSGMSRGNINKSIENFYATNPMGLNADASSTLNFMRNSGVNREDFQSWAGKNNYGPQMSMPSMQAQAQQPFNPFSNTSGYGGGLPMTAGYGGFGSPMGGLSPFVTNPMYQMQSPFSSQQSRYQPQMQTPFSFQQPSYQPQMRAPFSSQQQSYQPSYQPQQQYNPYQMQSPFSFQQPSYRGYGGYGGGNFIPDAPLSEGMMGTMGGTGYDPVTGRMDLGTAGGSGQYTPAPPRSSGPSQAIVGRSSQMRGTPNVMRRAEGGIASLMDDVE